MNKGPDAFEWNFEDVHALVQADEQHSDDEPRAVLIGYSNRNRILIVFHSPRPDNVIRIISARKVTPRERKIYENAPRS